jgi:transcriptional regulator with XRE-family HTH domain
MRHHVRMDRDWKRLGSAVKRARERLGLSQDELAEAAGPSRATIQVIEQGKGFSNIPKSIRKVAAYLGWPPDAVDVLLSGRDLPTVDPLASEPPAASTAVRTSFADGMPRRVINELTEGDVLDTIVFELSRATPNTKLVVVLKRDDSDGADPDDVKRDLREWSRIQRGLLALTSDDQDSSEPPTD